MKPFLLKSFLLLLLLCGRGLQPAALAAADKPLVVGMELAYPPFEMRDERGEPAGMSVDLALALGQALGRPVQIQNLPFDGLIPALKTGRIELIVSSLTATPERAASIDFSEPYLKTGLCLLAASRSDVRSVEDLSKTGRTVVVKKGTTGHLYAARHLTAARVVVLDKETTAALEVAQGKADAFIYDQMSTFKNWRKHPDSTRAVLEPFQTENWAMGIRKGNEALRTAVNTFLSDYKAAGGFERLGDKWLPEQKAEFKKRGVRFHF